MNLTTPDRLYVLEQDLSDMRARFYAACGVVICIALYAFWPQPKPLPPRLTFTRALRFENYFIVPVTDEHFIALTNKYPANVVTYPLIFK